MKVVLLRHQKDEVHEPMKASHRTLWLKEPSNPKASVTGEQENDTVRAHWKIKRFLDSLCFL